MADHDLRAAERAYAAEPSPANLEAMAVAAERAGLAPRLTVYATEAERAWAAETTPENLEAMAVAAERAGLAPRLLVYAVAFRPCRGQRVRTHRGEGRVTGTAPVDGGEKGTGSGRVVLLDDGSEVRVGARLVTTRVLDPVSWLQTKGGQRWARAHACAACVPKGYADARMHVAEAPCSVSPPYWALDDALHYTYCYDRKVEGAPRCTARKYCYMCYPGASACSACGHHVMPWHGLQHLFSHHSFCPEGKRQTKAKWVREGRCPRCGAQPNAAFQRPPRPHRPWTCHHAPVKPRSAKVQT